MEGLLREKLLENGATLSVAESCTGGLIGNTLTNVPGSSRYFQGGVIVYSNQAKIDLLDVSPETLERFGAVSDQTVQEMAAGVRKRLKTVLGLAVTGIAGPEGGTEHKPVGTVHIGLALPEDIFSGKFRFWGTRERIKRQTAMMALDWTRRYLYGYPLLPGI
jgi:nicotinamide-nucleotide amidase